MPSTEQPLTGRCACGTVRFEVTEPFASAGYCHCERCQHRSGVPASFNGLVAGSGFRITAGEDRLRSWVPDAGARPKWFCEECGGHVFGGEPGRDVIAVRFGAIEGDPGIEPSWRAWVSSAPDWYEIPDDGLARHEEGLPGR